jgi:hypothetical protein
LLSTIVNKRERKAATIASQLDSKRQAFFEESLRPDSKSNASDFVSDLDTLLDAPTPAPPLHLARFEATKAESLRRMVARSTAGSSEAARFDKNPQPSGVSNWFHRLILTFAERVRGGRAPTLRAGSVQANAPHGTLANWRELAAIFRAKFSLTLGARSKQIGMEPARMRRHFFVLPQGEEPIGADDVPTATAEPDERPEISP